MKCLKCGADLLEGAEFCHLCGARQLRRGEVAFPSQRPGATSARRRNALWAAARAGGAVVVVVVLAGVFLLFGTGAPRGPAASPQPAGSPASTTAEVSSVASPLVATAPPTDGGAILQQTIVAQQATIARLQTPVPAAPPTSVPTAAISLTYPIVGKWQQVTGSSVSNRGDVSFEFLNDGKLILQYGGSASGDGTYRILDGDRLQVELNYWRGDSLERFGHYSYISTSKIAGDRLVTDIMTFPPAPYIVQGKTVQSDPVLSVQEYQRVPDNQPPPTKIVVPTPQITNRIVGKWERESGAGIFLSRQEENADPRAPVSLEFLSNGAMSVAKQSGSLTGSYTVGGLAAPGYPQLGWTIGIRIGAVSSTYMFHFDPSRIELWFCPNTGGECETYYIPSQ